MIFGQGVIRCHPYLYSEIQAIQDQDVIQFDRLFWQHISFVIRNGFRAVLLSLSRGYLAKPPSSGATARYYRKLAWASATFSFLTDVALLCFGGSLKRHEKLTGRFADVVSWLYLSVATLRRFEAEGCQPADLPLMEWALQTSLMQIQQAIEGILLNLPMPAVVRAVVLAGWRVNPIGRAASDSLGSQVARQIQIPGVERDRLTAGIYLPTHPDETLGQLEQAFTLCVQAESIAKTLKAAARKSLSLDAAVTAGIISASEAQLLRAAESARNNAIQVDAFTLAEYRSVGALNQL